MKREDEYTILKVLTVLFVVMAHVTTFYTPEGGVIAMESNTLLNYFTKVIYSFHMPLFFFLSGAIFKRCIDAGKYKNIPMFIKKKFSRLMVPYFVWGCFYVAPVMTALKLTEFSLPEYIFRNIICNEDARHLWFLWALFFIFILARLLVPVLERHKILQAMVVLAVTILSYYAWDLPPDFGLSRILRYLQYFLWGYVFENNKKLADWIVDRRWYLTVAAGVVLCGAVILTDNYNVNFVLPYVGIFLCYSLVRNVNMNYQENRIYQTIKKNSMGIYLAHPMIIYSLFYFGKSIGNRMGILFSIVVFVIGLVMSILLTVFLRRRKLTRLLGEN